MIEDGRTLEEIEAELADLEVRRAEVEAKIEAAKVRQSRANAKPSQEKFESKFDADTQQLRRSMQDKPIQDFVAALLANQARHLEYMEQHSGPDQSYSGPNYYVNLATQRGVLRGIAAVLSALRETSISKEILKAAISNDMG